MKLIFVNTFNPDISLLDLIRIKSEELGVAPFKFATPIEYGISIDKIFPSKEIFNSMRYEDPSSDMMYLNYLLNNQDKEVTITFLNVLDSLLKRDYTFILTSYNDYIDSVIESILSIIRKRYSISGYILNTYEDFQEGLNETNFESQYGYQQYILDMEYRVKLLCELYGDKIIIGDVL